MNREKPLTANQRKLLKEAGLEQHPTDKNLVRPCHASMNDPVVTVKYVGPPAYRWWER